MAVCLVCNFAFFPTLPIMAFIFACNFTPLLWHQDKDKDEGKPKEREKDEEKEIYICLFCKLSPLLWRHAQFPFHNRRHLQRVLGTVKFFWVLKRIN